MLEVSNTFQSTTVILRVLLTYPQEKSLCNGTCPNTLMKKDDRKGHRNMIKY